MPQESFGLTKIVFNIRIGEMLVAAGSIDKKQLEEVLTIQKEMADKGQKKIVGDILVEQFGISQKEIEDIFAKYLIFTISQLFQEILHKDSSLSSYLGKLDYFMKKVDICIVKWELQDKDSSKVIDAEMVMLVTSINDHTVTVNIPFEYILEDQMANIDLLAAIEFVRSEFLDAKGLSTGVDLSKIGIQLPDPAEGPTKILFVDDEKPQRELMKRLLNRMGYAIETADSAESALKLMEKENFTLVITDLHMPGMDGTELCEKIKRFDTRPIVYALSGYITTFGPENLDDVGFDGYFAKPVSYNDLKHVIDDVAEK